MKKMSRRDRKNFNSGKSAGYVEGYAQGYAQGLHDGNPFVMIGETMSKMIGNLSETITDPKLLQALSEAKRTVEHNNELCWSTGNYTDECDCEFCSHKHECSGYGGDADALKNKLMIICSRRPKTQAICQHLFDVVDDCPTVEPKFKPIAEVKFDKEQLQEIVDKAKAEVLESVERPHGEWIIIHNALGETKYQCNQCRHFVKPSNDKNFCPNCGAEMRGEE